MTLPTSTTSRRSAALAATVAAGLSFAGAPAMARGVDPAVYDTGVPAGVVEHGVVHFTITGSPELRDEKIEYWATDDRWRSVTRDAKGRVVAEAFSTKHQTVYYSNGRGGPRVSSHKGRATPPMAGWTAAYNAKLVARGVLRPVGERTVAGLPGVVYQVPQDRKTTEPGAGDDKWVTDDTSGQTEIVLEKDTFAPLVRTTTLPGDNHGYGQFRQSEELESRERVSETAATRKPLSAKRKTSLVRTWKARVARARR